MSGIATYNGTMYKRLTMGDESAGPSRVQREREQERAGEEDKAPDDGSGQLIQCQCQL